MRLDDAMAAASDQARPDR